MGGIKRGDRNQTEAKDDEGRRISKKRTTNEMAPAFTK
jgi:hypothetical protein